MPNVLVTATLEGASGFTDDTVVNTFAFASEVDIDAGVVLDIHNAVTSFYNDVGAGQTWRIANYISNAVSRAAGDLILRMYDVTGHLDGSPHGSPIAEDAVTLAAAGSLTSLASQSALVLTLRARGAIDEPVEGPGLTRPRARKSGRLFIGPLVREAGEIDASGRNRPTAQFRTDLVNAAENLQDALVDGTYAWCVWSRADADMIPIVRAECDDAFDVLRSRRLAPTTRTVKTFAPVPDLVLAA